MLEGTVFGLQTGATLSQLTVTGGRSGGIVVGEGQSPHIRECTIAGNAAELSGGGCTAGGDRLRL